MSGGLRGAATAWGLAYFLLAFAFIAGFSIGPLFGLFAPAAVLLAGGLDLAAARRPVVAAGERGAYRWRVALLLAALGAFLAIAAGVMLTANWLVDGLDKALATSVSACLAVPAVWFRLRGMALRCSLFVLLWTLLAGLGGEWFYAPAAVSLLAAALATPHSSAEASVRVPSVAARGWPWVAARPLRKCPGSDTLRGT